MQLLHSTVFGLFFWWSFSKKTAALICRTPKILNSKVNQAKPPNAFVTCSVLFCSLQVFRLLPAWQVQSAARVCFLLTLCVLFLPTQSPWQHSLPPLPIWTVHWPKPIAPWCLHLDQLVSPWTPLSTVRPTDPHLALTFSAAEAGSAHSACIPGGCWNEIAQQLKVKPRAVFKTEV